MNGAHALIHTLADAGIAVCFMNPGTSEMHFVAALDDVPEMRPILVLFENIATGAADGYARITGVPAATLLHLGPGLANGWSMLHNARRASTPLVNVIGDHATYHKKYDAPLTSDITGIAEAVSGWVRTTMDPADLAADAVGAVAAARTAPAKIATLILPADVSWSEAADPMAALPLATPPAVDPEVIARAATALTSDTSSALLIGGRIVGDPDLLATGSRIAAATGTKYLAETFPARHRRGAGIAVVERLGYLAEFAEAQLAGIEHLIVVDTKSPVSFFAYPGKSSDLVPDGCEVIMLGAPDCDVPAALESLAVAVNATNDAILQEASRPELPSGDLNAQSLAAALGALLPEDAIVSDEGNTSGLFVTGATAGCPAHDWLCLTGGAIGQGLPVATGAAVAAPDRHVICLQSEGSAMYTIQALWTQAREQLDVTTIILNNHSYAILKMELSRVGAEDPGPVASSMLDLSGPDLDFVQLARGQGVPAERATDVASFADLFNSALSESGPHVIEVMLEPLF